LGKDPEMKLCFLGETEVGEEHVEVERQNQVMG
jgi:hypothetical protein